jgi:hypothetical protein
MFAVSKFKRSVECVVHIEEDDAEEPDGDEKVVDGHADVLFVLLYFDDQGHCVEDQHADEGYPGHYGVVDAVV